MFTALQSDDLKLHDKQSDSWTTFLLPEDIEAKYGSHDSRILKATSQGQGELAASLSYFSGHQETKEVRLKYFLLSFFPLWQHDPPSFTGKLTFLSGPYFFVGY